MYLLGMSLLRYAVSDLLFEQADSIHRDYKVCNGGIKDNLRGTVEVAVTTRSSVDRGTQRTEILAATHAFPLAAEGPSEKRTFGSFFAGIGVVPS